MTNYRARKLGAVLVGLTLTLACDGPSITPTRWYGISGVISEMTESGLGPVPTVEIKASSPGRSLASLTNPLGLYRIVVPPGDVTIGVSDGRFEPVSQRLTVTENFVFDFSMIRKPADSVLSGFVMENSPAGPMPVADVEMTATYCPPAPSGLRSVRVATTDAQGFYRIAGLCDSKGALSVYKPGYSLAPTGEPSCEEDDADCRRIEIVGNTRLDVLLVRY